MAPPRPTPSVPTEEVGRRIAHSLFHQRPIEDREPYCPNETPHCILSWNGEVARWACDVHGQLTTVWWRNTRRMNCPFSDLHDV